MNWNHTILTEQAPSWFLQNWTKPPSFASTPKARGEFQHDSRKVDIFLDKPNWVLSSNSKTYKPLQPSQGQALLKRHSNLKGLMSFSLLYKSCY